MATLLVMFRIPSLKAIYLYIFCNLFFLYCYMCLFVVLLLIILNIFFYRSVHFIFMKYTIYTTYIFQIQIVLLVQIYTYLFNLPASYLIDFNLGVAIIIPMIWISKLRS